MSKAVTPDEVKEFHRLYEQYGSYAEVAPGQGERLHHRKIHSYGGNDKGA